MGGCLSVKPKICGGRGWEPDNVLEYKPLFALKKDLLQKLDMDDDHFYSIFCTFRFNNSTRRKNAFLRETLKFREL